MKKTNLIIIGLCIGLVSCAQGLPVNAPEAGPTTNQIDVSSIDSKVNVKFKAAIIKNSGSIVPVARKDFIIRKYDFHKFHDSYLTTRNTANKPNFETDIKYNTNILNPDIAEQTKNVANLFQLNLKTWYDEVYSDFKNQLTKVSKEKSIIVKSDLSGEFDVNLEQGTTYYISGSYEDINNTITWSSFEFKPSDKKIELSNDNGKIKEVIENNPRRALDVFLNGQLLDEIFSRLKDL
jgi:hypothetical protein